MVQGDLVAKGGLHLSVAGVVLQGSVNGM
jgi:hypothetical protein